MFDFLKGRKKQSSAFDPRQEIQKLAELSPPSALIGLITNGDSDEAEDMGKSFFLRRDKKLYSERSNFYLTTPDNLKIAKDQNLTNRIVVLQFMNRRIPYRLVCKIVGRYRLLPEVVETLDFNAKAAYKLLPTGLLKKQDKRQFYRYTLKNYGDSRIRLTTHIGFDAFIRNTNQEFAEKGAPPGRLSTNSAPSCSRSNRMAARSTFPRSKRTIRPASSSAKTRNCYWEKLIFSGWRWNRCATYST